MANCRRCSHEKLAHEHYRSGSDCSACDCAKFKTSMLPMLRLRRHRQVGADATELTSHRATAA